MASGRFTALAFAATLAFGFSTALATDAPAAAAEPAAAVAAKPAAAAVEKPATQDVVTEKAIHADGGGDCAKPMGTALRKHRRIAARRGLKGPKARAITSLVIMAVKRALKPRHPLPVPPKNPPISRLKRSRARPTRDKSATAAQGPFRKDRKRKTFEAAPPGGRLSRFRPALPRQRVA